MAFSDYSLTPASNTTINGINIAENCPAANVNNALRQIAADGKSLSDTVAGISTSTLMLRRGYRRLPLRLPPLFRFRFVASKH